MLLDACELQPELQPVRLRADGCRCWGASATFTADAAYVGDAFYDVISPAQVFAAQTTSAAPGWFDEGRPLDWFEG